MADSEQGDNDTKVKRRRWPYVTFWLGVLVVLYLVIFRLPEPRLTLDYLKALIWPGLVAVVLYWLREPLRLKVAELLNLKGPGFEAHFANERLQEELTGPTATVLADTKGPESEGQVEGHDSFRLPDDRDAGVAPQTSDAAADPFGDRSMDKADDEPSGESFAQARADLREAQRTQEKRAIEEIMRVSAWWGYDMARLGFKTRPTPVVEWTEEGRPLIQYARGEPGQSVNIPVQRKGTTPDLKVMASRLENEIRDLEAKVDSPMSIRDYAQSVNAEARKDGERARLRRLKSQLRTIDPDSPLGIE